ncbi:hypothetical protein IFM89_008314, partial [Coptis chinensis]
APLTDLEIEDLIAELSEVERGQQRRKNHWRRSHSHKLKLMDEESPPRLGNSSNLLGSNANSTVLKRSPSLPSAEQALPGTSYSTVADTERETQAKAKRLAHFGVELSQPVLKRGDFMLSDYEGPESSSVIIGLCPVCALGSAIVRGDKAMQLLGSGLKVKKYEL